MILGTLHQRVSAVFKRKRPIRHLSTQEAGQTAQACLQRYKSVNESHHLHLKQSYHGGTAPSQPFKNLLRPVAPSPSTTALRLVLLSPTYSSPSVCACVIGVDISGVCMCLGLFWRGRMIKSVWACTNMCVGVCVRDQGRSGSV